MKGISLNLLLFIAATLLIDVYAFNGLRALSKKWLFLGRKWFFYSYWAYLVLLLASLIFVVYVKVDLGIRLAIIVSFFGSLLFEFCFALFLLLVKTRLTAYPPILDLALKIFLKN